MLMRWLIRSPLSAALEELLEPAAAERGIVANVNPARANNAMAIQSPVSDRRLLSFLS
jgi:hypothetical protein